MLILRWSSSALLALCIATQALGRISPSFHIEDAAPRATHIVVATEGDQIDGHLRIIESWKGDIKVNQIIIVPEMKTWSQVDKRKILEKSKSWYKAAYPKVVERLPSHVSCNRIVLFLIRDGDNWRPASKTQRMSLSIAWVEDRDVLTYVQSFNPGPLELCPLYDLLDVFKTRVANVMYRQPEDFKANEKYVPGALQGSKKSS